MNYQPTYGRSASAPQNPAPTRRRAAGHSGNSAHLRPGAGHGMTTVIPLAPPSLPTAAQLLR